MKVICKECGKEIESKDELLVATKSTSVNAYHGKCYVNLLRKNKTAKSITLGKPINTPRWTILSGIIFVMGVLFSLFGGAQDNKARVIVILICIIPALYRLYSWYKYESKFDK
ncbi:hypothetical protein [Clostridium sp. JNZ J1-5]